ncbi:MAG: YHS domain protein [Alphaproteobacteria bacterium]|nr:YHS domain protein [Alphaproteobacteria bacterium]
MITRRNIVLGAAAGVAGGLVLAPTGVLASKQKNFVGWQDGVAINQTDPVGYFTQSAPVQGLKEFAAKWDEAIWYFASAENRDMFLATPEAYAPKYGGYCAFAMSFGSFADTVPEAWSIVDSALYLNQSLGVRTRWNADQAALIKRADQAWASV